MSVYHAVKNGLHIRYLTINPDSPFLKQKEREEQVLPGSIRKEIIDCIRFFSTIKTDFPDSIQIKTYESLPLDLFWRQDNILMVGPYLFGKTSQQTITYEYHAGSMGFKYYSDYFEQLWTDNSFCKEWIIKT